jgi:EpsI family protein
MPEMGNSNRRWITAAILLGAYFLLHSVSHGEPIVPRQPLHTLPYKLGDWMGSEHPLEDQVVQAVGVSDYTNRAYFESGGAPVYLYVGYYASQRTGDTIHSPKNCLPGSGWDPIQEGYATIRISESQTLSVNRYVIEKEQDKQLVFYWYQGRGRVIANEYLGKMWMMVDAISRNRTDGALVRLVTPLGDGEAKAQARLSAFAQLLFPSLDALIPK